MNNVRLWERRKANTAFVVRPGAAVKRPRSSADLPRQGLRAYTTSLQRTGTWTLAHCLAASEEVSSPVFPGCTCFLPSKLRSLSSKTRKQR